MAEGVLPTSTPLKVYGSVSGFDNDLGGKLAFSGWGTWSPDVPHAQVNPSPHRILPLDIHVGEKHVRIYLGQKPAPFYK